MFLLLHFKIDSLNSKVKEMEFERSKLLEINEKLNSISNINLNGNENITNNESDDNPIYSQKNIKLLEVRYLRI